MHSFHGAREVDLDPAIRVFGVRARPWIHAAHLTGDAGCALTPVDARHFAGEHRLIAGARFILLLRNNRSVRISAQGFDQQLRADFGHALRKLARRFHIADFGFALQQHIAGIHADVGQHRSYARHLFAVDDAPVDRRGAAVFRQERCVNVDRAVFRNIQNFLR